LAPPDTLGCFQGKKIQFQIVQKREREGRAGCKGGPTGKGVEVYGVPDFLGLTKDTMPGGNNMWGGVKDGRKRDREGLK